MVRRGCLLFFFVLRNRIRREKGLFCCFFPRIRPPHPYIAVLVLTVVTRPVEESRESGRVLSGGIPNLTCCVGTGQGFFKSHGSGRIRSDRIGSDRVGSGRIGSGRVGSGRVGSGHPGRVGSGRVGSGRVGSGRVGSGRVGSSRVGSGLPGLTLPARCDPISEKPC